MEQALNQSYGFDEVRWATNRKSSYDTKVSFAGKPNKSLLKPKTRLYRLMRMAAGTYFDGVWWMSEGVFNDLRAAVNQSQHGSGRMLRNYIAQALALPSGDVQLSIIEIELTQSVYAWIGQASSLFDRPGGTEQIFLPNLAQKGNPKTSDFAKVVRTYWLKF